MSNVSLVSCLQGTKLCHDIPATSKVKSRKCVTYSARVKSCCEDSPGMFSSGPDNPCNLAMINGVLMILDATPAVNRDEVGVRKEVINSDCVVYCVCTSNSLKENIYVSAYDLEIDPMKKSVNRNSLVDGEVTSNSIQVASLHKVATSSQ